METKKMKRMAIAGLIGGLQFAIGDLLVYLSPNYHNGSAIYTDWANMNMWRLALSFYLGCLGTGLLLIGFYSLYSITKQTCSDRFRHFLAVPAYGAVLTSIGHFFIACVVPMTYKGAISAGASDEMAKVIASSWELYINPLKVFIMLAVILVQSIMMIGLILKGKINCPKWMVLLNPVAFIIISIPISILLNGTGLEGITEAFESLGEGCMYLAVYYHWSRLEITHNRKLDYCHSIK
ncbi:MAG: hypothetical protein E7256_17225 [Lachnospiraceae bacterium]|nr:hypothetical protein [Lachnospiraceae bacterium]